MLPVLAQIPSGHNDEFTAKDLSFADYIATTRAMLTKSRIDLDKDDADKIIDANTPFEYRPPNFDGKRSILLVHGLCDSPFWMRDIAQFFVEQGFLVRAILLPGHGTRPGDLLNLNYHAWLEAVHYGITGLKKEASKVYFLGFSTGSALGVHHALHHGDLSALILVSHAQAFELVNQLATHISIVQQWFSDDDMWIARQTCHDYAKYRAFPMNGPRQVRMLIDENNKALDEHPISLPILMIQSKHDETVKSDVAIDFFKKQPNLNNRIIYYTDKPVEDDPRFINRSSHYPHENILHLSHVCLLTPPDNPHYGRIKDYDEPVLRNSKIKDKQRYQGALNRDVLLKYEFMRVTYNPDYEHLLQEIKRFLEKN